MKNSKLFLSDDFDHFLLMVLVDFGFKKMKIEERKGMHVQPLT